MKLRNLILCSLVGLSLAACDKPAPADEAAAAATAEAAPTEEAADKKEEAAEAVAEAAEEPVIEPRGEMAKDLDAGETKYYGSRFTVIEPPVTLAKAIEGADAHAGPYKVEATIEKVCKKKGCWFTMKDDSIEEPVRVKMKDYGFFVPRNADGTVAVVEGTLASREIPQDEAQHYADDEAAAGGEPRKVEGPVKAWEFTATAIQLTKQADG